MKNAIVTEHDVYVAYISPDDRKIVPYGYYMSYYEAVHDSKGKSWYGSNGSVDKRPKKAICLTYEDGSQQYFLVESNVQIQFESDEARLAREKEEKDARIKDMALSKLSSEERRVLGLA